MRALRIAGISLGLVLGLGACMPDIAAIGGGGKGRSVSLGTPAAAGGLDQRTVMAAGLERSYHIYVPKSVAAAGGSAPAIVTFHGGGGNALEFAKRIDIRRVADARGMIVLAPQGVGRGDKGFWNAGSISPVGMAERNNVDDLAFIQAMLRDAASVAPIDPSRVYAAGLSKGGMLAYHAACNLPGTFTAIAAVASTLSAADCPNPQGVSLLHIHGTDDKNVPFSGGSGEMSAKGANWPPASLGIERFSAANQCAPQAQVMRPAQDTTCQVTSCAGGEKVELCLVEGGGHAWPGIEPAPWQQKYGVYVSPYFKATDFVVDFLLSSN
ncbi:polyhydroxybutyrate depolymerase [Rhodovulum bhavnagarense]|uniref:Polyhydroxybutyrate depolymerase n=1 Tax=Rhodovulum bhavnagarense TaxID=992286 RepID=A0A4R2RI32_9RHOB|nr:PHB depolymerase family esterase [Rhodovulum bhavnagarense]TCP63420.1 polyhydroxybutyrate depolymerase [Rhodovulum bhavnagarense]